MKVGLVVPGGVDRSGERRVIPALLWLIRRLRAVVDLRVFALLQERHRTTYELEGVPVVNVGARLTRPRGVRELLSAHRREPFDLLHAFWAGAPGAVATGAGVVLRRPALVHVAGGELVRHDDIRYGGRRTWRGRMQTAWVMRRATAITGASTPVIRAVAELGRTAERVPLGIGREDWPLRPPRERAAGAPLRVVQVASLNRVKDQRTLLTAVRHAVQRGVDCRLDVVGQDTLDGAVQRYAGELGIGTRVTFHGFQVQRVVRTLVEGADIAVVSSRYEAGPVVLGEAASVGVPTVGTAVGQLVDWAPDAAVTVPVGDAPAMAAAILDLASNESRRLAVARAAYLRAQTEDADWTARQFLRLYDAIV